MSAEERALKAINVTRFLLQEALSSPEALIQMTAWDIEPEAMEETITKILEYLEKKSEEKARET